MTSLRSAVAVAILAAATPAFGADGTGVVRGRVTDDQARPLGNVQVIAQSIGLPGRDTAQTTANGHYAFRALPDGEYVLTFLREGFVAHKITTRLSPGEVATVDAVLVAATRTSGAPDPIVITLEDKDAFIRHPLVAVTHRRDSLQMLPVLGNATSALTLGPGTVAPHLFEPGVWLDDTPLTLAWPDRRSALPIDVGRDMPAEVTLIRAGAPAEFGPSQAGAIHVAPRRGADFFSGSLQVIGGAAGAQADSVGAARDTANGVASAEGAIGGPVLRGQTWFFGSVAGDSTRFMEETAILGAPFESRRRNAAVFGRLTHRLGDRHRIDASLSRAATRATLALFDDWRVADAAAASTDDTVQSVWAVRATSQVGRATQLELRVSGEAISMEAPASVGTAVLDLPARVGYGAPRGCLGCGESTRSVMTGRAVLHHLFDIGSRAHDITAGFETSGHRSRPALGSGDRVELHASRTLVSAVGPVPVLVPNGSSAFVWWPAVESDLDGRSHAAFVGDRWRDPRGWTIDAGLRFEWWDLNPPNGVRVLNEFALSPRVSVAWEPGGVYAWRWSASVAQYAGGIPWSAEDLSMATASSWRLFEYTGQPFSTAGAPSAAVVPGVTTVAGDRSRAPQTTEWATGAGRRLGRVETRMDFVYRDSGALRARQVTPGAAGADDLGQPADRGVPSRVEAFWRKSAELTVQAHYRIGILASAGAAYTLSRLWGTMDERFGDDPSQRLAIGYPAYFDAAWAAPAGDLTRDRRHRVLLWATGQPIESESIGRLTVGLLARVESGVPVGRVGWIDSRPFVANPGVTQAPAAVPYYFTPRDAFRAEGMSRLDLSFQFARRLPRTLRGEWFVRADVLNLLNERAPLDPWRDAVVVTALQDPSRLAAFNPFAETPVEGVHWAVDSRLQSNGEALRTMPRSLRWFVGIRF